MTTNNVLLEAGDIVHHAAQTGLKQALTERRLALRLVHSRLNADVSPAQDRDLEEAVQRAHDSWLDACTWWNFLFGISATDVPWDRQNERG